MTRSKEKFIFNAFGIVIHIFLNIIFYILVVYAIVMASRFVYTFSYQVFGSVKMTEKASNDIEITINKGDSTMKVATLLEREKIIPNKYSFYVRAKLAKQNILPGKYKLNGSMDYGQIFEIITRSKEDRNGRT